MLIKRERFIIYIKKIVSFICFYRNICSDVFRYICNIFSQIMNCWNANPGLVTSKSTSKMLLWVSLNFCFDVGKNPECLSQSVAYMRCRIASPDDHLLFVYTAPYVHVLRKRKKILGDGEKMTSENDKKKEKCIQVVAITITASHQSRMYVCVYSL